MRRAWPGALLLLALGASAPSALALDVLPSESTLGADEARVLVRAEGTLRVRAEPAIAVARAEEEPPAWSPTPFATPAHGTWRGIEGVVLLALRRPDPSTTVQVYFEDDTSVGAWVEWPGTTLGVAGAGRAVPSGVAGSSVGTATLLVAAAFILRRRDASVCGTK